MQTQKPVIANYIIFLAVFLFCAALIAALFIYRSQHQETNGLINTDTSMIMTMGRDIKSVDLERTDSKPFTNRDLLSHWTLLFFGFTNCNSVCPITMEMMGKAYPTLHAQFPNLQVVLVSLDPERDNKATLKKYTASFHPDFIGVSGKIESIRKLQGELGIYSAVDPQTDKTGNYQLQHTASIMLISPQGKWVGMIKFGLTPVAFQQAVSNAIVVVTKATT